MKTQFSRIATWISWAAGTPVAFLFAASTILAWTVGGFFVGFDNTLYQLLINTGTTVVTYLLLFIVQNTQNRDSVAVHVKLDEIIRALPAARTTLALADLENATEEQLETYRQDLKTLATQDHPQ